MAKRKEERLPKGFGGVIFMKGNRAKPYMVRIKVGTTINEEKGTAYPKYKIIGYAKTRADGIFDVCRNTITTLMIMKITTLLLIFIRKHLMNLSPINLNRVFKHINLHLRYVKNFMI